MATIKEKIGGLYILFFNRAADKDGLDYWVNEAESLSEDTAIKTLAASFAEHPQFTELYDGLDNTEYVEAIYINTLGQAGDTEGIAYWSSLLDNGLSRSDMVADFVSAALDFDREDSQYESLSEAELDAASERQQLLQNEVDVSLYFVDNFENETNLDPTTDPSDPSSLEEDPVYLASIEILSSVTSDIESKENVIESLDLLKENVDDPIAIINEVDDISPEQVAIVLDENAPEFTSPATAVSVDENIAAGTVIYTAQASDDTSSVVYSLAQSGDAELLAIDPQSGAVSVVASPDYESKSSYSFTVVATDANGNSSEVSVSVDVNDIDENAPEFTSPATAVSVDENIAAGTVVYRATATDESSVTYSLDQSGDSDLLAIDANSGEVILLESPDYESKSSYTFTVVATDIEGNSSELDLSFNVNDIDESEPTPSYQITGIGDVSTVETEWVDTLLSEEYWDESQTVITYSFNTSIPDDYYDYGDGTELTTGWTELNDAQKSAMESIFDGVDDLLNVTFERVDSDGMIQLNIVDMDAGTSGFAFYPGDYYSYEGDIFLSSQFNTDPDKYSLEPGGEGWNTMAHELGHALGLEHPFEGDYVLPSDLDDTNHTIMSYTDRDNYYATFEITETDDGKSISASGDKIGSDLYSLYDVNALQAIYGVNDTVATGDDTYTLSFTDFEIETIWDAGGVDTLDLSAGLGSSTIDLNPGSLNSADEYSLDEVVSFYQNEVGDSDFNDFINDFIVDTLAGDSLLYTGKNNLAIATGTIIENVKTGSGDDIITDNLVDNNIYTAAGDDQIYLGYGGYDYVDGGSGTDIVYLDLTQDSVTLTQLDSGAYDILANDNSFEANLIGIETISFSDGTVTL